MSEILFSTIKDIVIFLLAIYGAILSTFNLIQAMRKERRSVSVRFSTVMPAHGEHLGPCFAKIEAVNVGHRPVTISTLTLELPSHHKLLSLQSDRLPGMPDTRLPAVLSDGQAAHFFISYADVAAALTHAGFSGETALTPYCEDTIGNVYRGKPWRAVPGQIAQM